MRKSTNGFTLVEILIVVIIVTILATITTLGYTNIQASSRDSQRQARASLISEALEKYYAKNGEYPAASVLTGQVSTARTTLGIDDDSVFLAPSASPTTTNSLSSQDIVQNEGQNVSVNDDRYAYIVDCNTDDNSCQKFELRYIQESTNDVITISSRGRSQDSQGSGDTTPGALQPPDSPTIQLTVNATTVVGTIQADVDCETGSPEYKVRSRLNGGIWSVWSSYASRASTSTSRALTAGTTYGFQGIARCNDGSTTSVDSAEGVEAEYYHPTNATTPSMSAALIGGLATGTSSVVTCESGFTPEYQVRSRENDGTWSTWSAWSSTRTKGVTPSQGVKYGFQAHSRCGSTGTISSDSNIANYTHPISAPAIPGLTVVFVKNTSGTMVARATIDTITCPAGTTPQYRLAYRFNADSLTYGSWGSTRVRDITAYYGARHTFRGLSRCYNANTVSAETTTATVDKVRPFISLTKSGGVIVCKQGSGGCTWQQRFSFTHASPTSGMSVDYGTWQCRKKRVSSGTWTSWSSDMSGSASNAGDSKCGYISCSQHNYIQFRYTFVRATSPYDTGPSIAPTTNEAKCNY